MEEYTSSDSEDDSIIDSDQSDDDVISEIKVIQKQVEDEDEVSLGEAEVSLGETVVDVKKEDVDVVEEIVDVVEEEEKSSKTQYNYEDLNKLKIKDIKDICKDLGIQNTGSKDSLINKIINNNN